MAASLYTILVDNREKRPLQFPSSIVLSYPKKRTAILHTRSVKLPFADYCLEGQAETALIERKGSLDEIATNCLDPRRRACFEKELDHLRSACRNPLILFEGDPHSLSHPTARNPDPSVALDSFQRLLLTYQIPCLFIRTSTVDHLRSLGVWCARWLINASSIGDPSCVSTLSPLKTALATSTSPAPPPITSVEPPAKSG